jgi:hypothetical protein
MATPGNPERPLSGFDAAGEVRTHQDDCGPTDYVARMGGDEFVMLMSGENREKLEFKIDSMRSVVRRAGEVTLEPSLLRMSVGILSLLRLPYSGIHGNGVLLPAIACPTERPATASRTSSSVTPTGNLRSRRSPSKSR